MDWLHFTWRLNVRKQNERTDEPALQIALVTIIDGVVHVHPHDTGQLRSGRGYRWGSIRSGMHVPNPDNPYLGVVMRAIELDNSGSDRNLDRDRYFEDIRIFTQTIVNERPGSIPTANQLLQAGAKRNLIDNFGDDDDRIGVNARAFPNIGNYDANENLWTYHYDVAFEDTRQGQCYFRTQRQLSNLPFQETGAYYDLIAQAVITPERPIRSFP